MEAKASEFIESGTRTVVNYCETSDNLTQMRTDIKNILDNLKCKKSDCHSKGTLRKSLYYYKAKFINV